MGTGGHEVTGVDKVFREYREEDLGLTCECTHAQLLQSCPTNDTLCPAEQRKPLDDSDTRATILYMGMRGTSRQLCHHALHSRKQAPESWNQFSTLSALPCL